MRFAKFNGFIVVLGMVVIGACAKVGSPSGGPRDVDPPVVMESVPPNGTTNFKGNKFVLEFDEYVMIDKVSEKLMVSPPLNKKPTVSMKGKSVTVEYEDILKDSTTYTFYFQDALKDLNEGNAIENFQFVFSTGDIIDSLSLKGNIYYGLSLDPPAEALVMLYSNLSDTAFRTMLPDYITKASKEGEFRIDNIREGRYRLFGLEDQDNSKNFNLADEVVAFYGPVVNITPEENYFDEDEEPQDTISTDDITDVVDKAATSLGVPEVADVISDIAVEVAESFLQPDTSLDDNKYALYLFQPEKSQRYLSASTRVSARELIYTVSLPPGPYSFGFRLPGDGNDDFITERTVNSDTLTVWLLDTTYANQQSLKTIVNYPFTDSTGTVVQREDTITLRYTAPKTTGRAREETQEPLVRPYEVSANFSPGKISPLLKLRLDASTPFGEIEQDKISLYEVRDSVMIKNQISVVLDSINHKRINVEAPLSQDVDYVFVADSAAFRDIFGLVSDSLGVKFVLNTDDKYGKLIFRISGYEGPRIVQLLSQDEKKTVREYYQESDGPLEMPYLDKGKYRLRVIYDLDSDRKWTPGDYERLKQPEPVSFFPEEIEVKVNWEQIYDWDISVQNQKAKRNISK